MSPTDPDGLRVALRVLEVLDRLAVPYHLGGSYASSIHGIPRQTQDIDLVVDLQQERVRGLVEALSDAFYVDEVAVTRAVKERGTCNLVHHATGIKVDLFIKGAAAFDAAEFDRKVAVRLGDERPQEVFVKSAEDTLLRKLLWYRSGGEVSDRQWGDVRGILRIQAGRLDLAYLQDWAERLGIDDLLARLLAEK